MTRIATTGWMMIAAAALAACGAQSDASGDPPRPADTAASAALPIDTPAPAPSDTASPPVVTERDTSVTPWRALEMPSEPWTQSAENPEALLRRVRDVVAAQLEEPDASVLPTRMESVSADSAVGILVEPVTGDDSIRETEFRLRMRREGSTWTVVAGERRERCRRGVAEGGLCL